VLKYITIQNAIVMLHQLLSFLRNESGMNFLIDTLENEDAEDERGLFDVRGGVLERSRLEEEMMGETKVEGAGEVVVGVEEEEEAGWEDGMLLTTAL
jgi:hypothetical protein